MHYSISSQSCSTTSIERNWAELSVLVVEMQLEVRVSSSSLQSIVLELLTPYKGMNLDNWISKVGTLTFDELKWRTGVSEEIVDHCDFRSSPMSDQIDGLATIS